MVGFVDVLSSPFFLLCLALFCNSLWTVKMRWYEHQWYTLDFLKRGWSLGSNNVSWGSSSFDGFFLMMMKSRSLLRFFLFVDLYFFMIFPANCRFPFNSSTYALRTTISDPRKAEVAELAQKSGLGLMFGLGLFKQ